MGTQSFSFVPRSWQDEKYHFFIELKTYHLSFSVYKHDAIDIAGPSSMQGTCHMNFIIDLTFFLFTNMTLSTLLVLAVCRARVI